ncbi:MAG TPA: chemotaxis protein CheB [Solirubrobacteraceae bacterium]|nr:chemotaxis protein CheB [Solirubrobacteraceae bacterium]
MTHPLESAPDRPRGPSVVVAGASAGGVEALVALVGTLPADFPYPVLVVLHVSPSGTSVLPAILSRACSLPVAAPLDGDHIQPGRVYVAPPDSHLVVEDSHLRLSKAPRENGHRPAIDPTMRSAAQFYDGSTFGIVLSGSRDDGTAGLLAIKAGGGTAIVQDPAEALYDAMPLSALSHVDVDAVLPVSEMASWILANAPDPPDRTENPVSNEPVVNTGERTASGEGTRYTCPDCGGVLFERHEGALERFECSVGHVFSIESLSSAQASTLEGALWAAVRALDDRAALLKRMAARARANGHRRSAATFERQAEEALERASTIRLRIEMTSDDLSEAAGA